MSQKDVKNRWKKLDTFREKLWNGTENTCVSMKTPNVLISDIALLACNRWPNLSILQFFVNLLNKRITNTRAILFPSVN